MRVSRTVSPRWQLPGTTTDRHIGYAVQWFAFAATACAIWFSVSLRRTWRPCLRGQHGTSCGAPALLLLAAIFFVAVGALATYHYGGRMEPAAGVAARRADRAATAVAGIYRSLRPRSAAPAERLAGSWLLVYVANDACAARCPRVTDMSQARLAPDNAAGRVQRVLLHGGACCDAGFGADDSDLRLLAAPGAAGASLRKLFPPAATGELGIYIVDPHGNLMMSYPASGAASGIHKDLERLLRLSHIGYSTHIGARRGVAGFAASRRGRQCCARSSSWRRWVRLTNAGLGCPDWPAGRTDNPGRSSSELRDRAANPGGRSTTKALKNGETATSSVRWFLVLAIAALSVANRRDRNNPGLPW